MSSFAGVATLAIVMMVGGPLAAVDAVEALATVLAPPAAVAPVAAPEVAPPPPPPPPITLVLNTDLGAQRLTVIENGKAKYTWPISSGRRGFATATGTFHPQWASK